MKVKRFYKKIIRILANCYSNSKLTFDIAGDSLTMLAILKIYFMERKYNERNYNRETYFE